MRVNSISNTRNQSFRSVGYSPMTKTIVQEAVKKNPSPEWLEKLTEIQKAMDKLKDTEYGHIIIDIKDNDLSKPKCLVYLVKLLSPVFDKNNKMTPKIIPAKVESSAQIKINSNTGLPVEVYASEREAREAARKNAEMNGETNRQIGIGKVMVYSPTPLSCITPGENTGVIVSFYESLEEAVKAVEDNERKQNQAITDKFKASFTKKKKSINPSPQIKKENEPPTKVQHSQQKPQIAAPEVIVERVETEDESFIKRLWHSLRNRT